MTVLCYQEDRCRQLVAGQDRKGMVVDGGEPVVERERGMSPWKPPAAVEPADGLAKGENGPSPSDPSHLLFQCLRGH